MCNHTESREPPLPDDVESLQRLIIEQRELIAAAQATLLERDLLIGKMRIELARLKRMQFGRSSEALDTEIAQLELTLEDLEARSTEEPPLVQPGFSISTIFLREADSASR